MKKIALITGASRGVGFETALKLTEDFNYTVIAVSRDINKLAKLEAIAPAGKMICIPFDIAGSLNIADKLNALKITHIDVLINNAGRLVNKSFEHITEDDLLQSYKVNVFAPILISQSLLPLLKKSTSAHIVNISSMGGFQGAEKFPGLSAYSTSKAALACFTECLAVELKDSAISVNCLCLGSVQTEMLEMAFPGYKAQVSASQMADYVCRFADEGHKYMNGKILPVSLSTP